MAKTKKFDYRIVEDSNCWTAEILRRATSKKTIVSKSQSGFATKAEAEEWGQKELKAFLHNLNERNKRGSKHREQ